VSVVELRSIKPSNELTGRVEAVQHVDIRPRVSGYVTAVRYREGADVAAGTVLFTIDPRPYQAAFAKATAEVARAKSRVELAKLEAGRAEKLLEANAIARAERDTTAASAAQAEAELQAAQAALQLARLDLEFTQVRAPFAGRTGLANVHVGDYVAAGPTTTLTRLVSLDPAYVYFTGDEQMYLRYVSRAAQSPVSFGLADEAGFPHEGTVDFVDNRVDAATGTVVVRAVVPNHDKRLTPGLYARVRIPESDAIEAALVDDKAVLTDQDRKYVYVLAGDTVERRDVKLGRVIDGKRLVTDGLKAGDAVIVSGIQKVFPGSKATAAKPETAAVKVP
jgi:multidrug efflux system membrane fusion protein